MWRYIRTELRAAADIRDSRYDVACSNRSLIAGDRTSVSSTTPNPERRLSHNNSVPTTPAATHTTAAIHRTQAATRPHFSFIFDDNATTLCPEKSLSPRPQRLIGATPFWYQRRTKSHVNEDKLIRATKPQGTFIEHCRYVLVSAFTSCLAASVT